MVRSFFAGTNVLADGVELGKGTVKLRVRKQILRVFAPPAGAGVEAPRREEVKELPAQVGAPVYPEQAKVASQPSDGAGEKTATNA